MIELTVAESANQIGYCGLACNFCHLWEDCGGCQSPDNHCRKRRAPEGCYQYTCCKAKGLNGCWECAVFPCDKDMFAPGHGIRIKAFVRCVREDGVAKLAWYLQRNAERGIRYHIGNTERGDYDDLADEAEVLRLLRDGKSQLTNVRFYGKRPYQAAVLHGGPGALGSVAAIARELSKNYGLIEPLQTKKTIAALLVELDDAVTGYCGQPATLIGHSWGAWLACLYAARYPGRAKKIILVGGGPFEPQYGDAIGKNRRGRLSETEGLEFNALIAALDDPQIANKDSLLTRLGELVAKADNFCPIELETDRIDCLPADGDLYNAIWSEAAGLRASGALLETVAQITCPVVVVHGAVDPHPLEGVKEPLEKRIKDLTVYFLEKCGHTPWKEQYARERFFEIIRKELGE